MAGLDQLPAIEQVLTETEALLRAATPSPAVRELRVRQGMLLRVVRGWIHIPPHDAQIAAMLECVLDLRASVVRTCAATDGSLASVARRTTRPAMARVTARPAQTRTTRPPPRREATRTTRPPPRRERS